MVYVAITISVLSTAALCSGCYFSFKNKTRRLLAMRAASSNGRSAPGASTNGARARRAKYTRLGQDDADYELRSTFVIYRLIKFITSRILKYFSDAFMSSETDYMTFEQIT